MSASIKETLGQDGIEFEKDYTDFTLAQRAIAGAVGHQINSYKKNPLPTEPLYLDPSIPVLREVGKLISHYQANKAIVQDDETLNIRRERHPSSSWQDYIDSLPKIPAYMPQNFPEEMRQAQKFLQDERIPMAFVFGSASIADPWAEEVGTIIGENGFGIAIGGDGRNDYNAMKRSAEAAYNAGANPFVVISTKELMLQQGANGYHRLIVADDIDQRIDMMWTIAPAPGRLAALRGGLGTIQELLRAIKRNEESKPDEKRIIAIVDNGFHAGAFEFFDFLGVSDKVDRLKNPSQFKDWLNPSGIYRKPSRPTSSVLFQGQNL